MRTEQCEAADSFSGFGFFLLGCAAVSFGQTDGYAEFIRTATQKWNEYLSGLANYECSVSVSVRNQPDTEEKYETNVVFNCPNYAIDGMKDGSVNTAVCCGEQYSFRLERDSETKSLDIQTLCENKTAPDRNFWVRSFSETDLPEDDWYGGGGRSIAVQVGRALHLFASTFLPQLFHFESFSIDRLTEDGDRFQVDYTFEPESDETSPPNSEGRLTPVRSGHLVLLKDSYLPESADFTAAGHRVLLTFEYETIGGKTVLKNKKQEFFAGDEVRTTLFSCDNIRFKKAPSSRFRLSYYGIPEPDFVKPTWSRYIFILLGVIIILAAVGQIIGKSRKKGIEVK